MVGYRYIGVLLLMLPAATPFAAELSGKEAYAQYCASCHGESGEGVPRAPLSLNSEHQS